MSVNELAPPGGDNDQPAQPKVISTISVVLTRDPKGERVYVVPSGEPRDELSTLRMLAAAMKAITDCAVQQAAQRIVLPFAGAVPPVRPIRRSI